MEVQYWDKFVKTGKIENYLRYKEVDFQGAEHNDCKQISDRDRDHSVSDAHRGIR